jgi:holo-[acyl-carrier protein] synthase
MGILGTGIDMIEVERVEHALTRPRTGERFRDRVYTEREVAYCESRGRPRYQSYAARFAAKEAAMKALGTGHSRGVYWTGIEVVRRHGPPRLAFHGGAAARLQAMGATGSMVTLTHSRELAIAHVMLLKE